VDNGKCPVLPDSEFHHIDHAYYFSISLLSTLHIEIPILYLPLSHGVVLALDIDLILDGIERAILLLVVFLEKGQLWLVEKEALLLEEDTLHVFALDVMDASDVLRQQLLLGLLDGLLSLFLLDLRKTAIEVSLGVVLLWWEQLL
jgi:hypothetical protein